MASPFLMSFFGALQHNFPKNGSNQSVLASPQRNRKIRNLSRSPLRYRSRSRSREFERNSFKKMREKKSYHHKELYSSPIPRKTSSKRKEASKLRNRSKENTLIVKKRVETRSPKKKDNIVKCSGIIKLLKEAEKKDESSCQSQSFLGLFSSKIPLNENSSNVDPRKMLVPVLEAKEKLNLVLDIDETLLNAHTVSADAKVPLMKGMKIEDLKAINHGLTRTLVVLRPFLTEFLERASKYYNIYAYSHGWYEYVQNVLDIIDQDKKYIRRDVIFKNQGQVTSQTPKLLSNLGFTPEQIQKTIILDDQRQIWEKDHHRVISSKKFIPFKSLMDEKKYNKHLLFVGQQGKIPKSRWLQINDVLSYAETQVGNMKKGQLEMICGFLEDLAQDYLKAKSSNYDLELCALYQTKMKEILKGVNVAIASASHERIDLFEDMVRTLGASLVDPSKAHYFLLDTNLDESQREFIKRNLDEKPLASALSIFWVVECFFKLKKVSTAEYQYQNL